MAWLILPVGYLGVYANVRDGSGKPLYPFLDPVAGNFWSWVGIMVGVFVAVGYLVWLVGRAHRSRYESGRSLRMARNG